MMKTQIEMETSQKTNSRLMRRGNYADVQGVRIHYVVKGEGFPIMLVHGLGAYSYTWRKNIDLLARYFQVYAIDLKGFGLSDKPIGPGYSIDHHHHVTMVREFMNTMGISRTHYVGSSMGGEIGLRLALDDPEKIDQLVLIGSSGYRDRIPYRIRLPGYLPYGSIVKKFVRRKFMKEEDLVQIVKAAYYNPHVINEAEIQGYLYPVFLPGFEEAYLTMLREFDFGKRKFEYYKIPHRTLLLAGEYDSVIPKEHTLRLNQDIHNSALITVPQCGHFLHEEKYSEVNEAIRQFLL